MSLQFEFIVEKLKKNSQREMTARLEKGKRTSKSLFKTEVILNLETKSALRLMAEEKNSRAHISLL